MKPVKLKDINKGVWFTRKPIENPKENQVYIKSTYDRTIKKYSCIKYSDINSEIMLKGETIVYIDFTF